MPLAAPVTLQLTPEAYFAWEEAQEVRHEYVHGEVYPLAGATRAHTLIAGNFFFALRLALADSPCTVFGEGMRVQVEAGDRYTYPDLCVACEEAYADARQTTLVTPTVVVEVLSESTEAYDRGEKLVAYRKVESLREIVLVAQDRRAAEVYARVSDGRWTLTEVSDGAVLPLASLQSEIALADLYAGVEQA